MVLLVDWMTSVSSFATSASEEVVPPSAKKLFYRYQDREHTATEHATYLGAMFGVSIGAYYVSQSETISNNGSFKNWRSHFGHFVLDKDEPVWNWVVHPYSGSQLFLFYRANGYSRIDSFFMTFIQSAFFEIFIEIYTEPASIQDLYQTPVWGSILGIFLEKSSLYLLNSDFIIGKVFGHLLNPATLFWFYEGKIEIIPTIKNRDEAKLTFIINY